MCPFVSLSVCLCTYLLTNLPAGIPAPNQPTTHHGTANNMPISPYVAVPFFDHDVIVYDNNSQVIKQNKITESLLLWLFKNANANTIALVKGGK